MKLRALDAGDFERTFRWHNDPELYASLGGTFRFTSRQTEEEWLKRMQAYSPQAVNLAICDAASGAHVGNIYLRDIDPVGRHGEVHVFIGEADQRGKGLGSAALRLLMRHAFEDLGLERLFLYVLAENRAAVKAYEKCGFVVEGTLRSHAFKSGEFKDLLVMGVLKRDL